MKNEIVVCKECKRVWTLNGLPLKWKIDKRKLGTCYCGINLYNKNNVEVYK
jgi:hypothetical protein